MNFVRGTPTLVQAFVVYYVLPDYGILLSATLTGVIVLGVHYAAYSAEVYRSGIDAVPRGQWEAAKALGLTPARTMARIVLPPAVRTSVPPLVNLVIAMYKETAVLFVIGIPILLYVGQTEANQSFRYLESYTLVGVLYLLVSYPSVLILRRFEASND
ncbi:MAG: polar amino acid transport system permease protein [Solirubrobacteraceae bacterium]